MDGGTELAERVRGLEAKLVEARKAITLKDGELEDLRSQVDEARAEVGRTQREAAGKVRAMEQQLDNERVQAELAMLRALEALRTEHQLAIKREKDLMDDERRRMTS